MVKSSLLNVLFIVVDDLSTAFEQYGGHAITPNLGRLAAESVQFQNAHVSVAVCSPSRTAFLTGLRPDTTQVWTIGPYFRNTSRGEGLEVVTLPQLFRSAGYNVTGAGKIFHPGTPSGGLMKSEGGGDQCPAQSAINDCARAPGTSEAGSWSLPHQFCDQYSNDTVQSPAMQAWPCAHADWPSCGAGCVQDDECIQCFTACGTWGQLGAWASCDCPDACYPEGLILEQSMRVLRDKVVALDQTAADPSAGGRARTGPWFHAVGFKRPHLSYRAPKRFFEQYRTEEMPLPKHRMPSPTAPPISYSHSCVEDTRAGKEQEEDDGMGGAIYAADDPAAKSCVPLVVNRTVPEFNGTATSYIEINTNDTAVRELRRAYYAAVSFTDHVVGRLLDGLKQLSLDTSTVVTFIGDHGYQLGEKGEWCKSNLFELATRVPLYVRVPPSLDGGGWRRGVKEHTVVESVDLYPTLADLAGLKLPPQRLGGESLRPLLRNEMAGEARYAGMRGKDWALTQWPRRAECTTRHGCADGQGNPWQPTEDGQSAALMGYKLRTSRWAYVVWVGFDWGVGGDPSGNATKPKWDQISARELYDHDGDDGSAMSGEEYEWTNLAHEPKYSTLVSELHAKLEAVVKTGLVHPIVRREQGGESNVLIS